jgi:hypothetical protein
MSISEVQYFYVLCPHICIESTHIFHEEISSDLLVEEYFVGFVLTFFKRWRFYISL